MRMFGDGAFEDVDESNKGSDLPFFLSINSFRDPRGCLGALEGSSLPFSIRRVYYLYDVPIGAIRGEHGHKQLQQVFICMSGSCDVILFDGVKEYLFHMSDPANALYVPAGMWRRLKFREAGTVICVLASRPYEPSDYLYTFEDYLQWVKGGKLLEEVSE